MSPHLDEATLEALAHEREDLVAAEARAHLDGCADCTALLHEARALSRVAGSALRIATPDVADLDALVRAVVAAAPVVVPAPRASRRSLLFGAGIAAPAALMLGVASLTGLGVGGLLHSLREVLAVASTLVRLAVVHVPPSVGATTAASGALLLALLVLAMRVLIRGPRALPAAVEVVR